MEGLTKNYVAFSRLVFVFRIFGTTFLKFKKLCFVLKKFVFKSEVPSLTDIESNLSLEESSTAEFIATCQSLNSILPELASDSHKTLVQELHEYGMKSNIPTGCVLLSHRQKCRSCGKAVTEEKKQHTVMIYDLRYGPLVGSRITKCCRKCKIFEHHGYWTHEGLKHYDIESIDGHYLLTSEETAVDIEVLKEVSNLLIVGAVPFSTYATSYNRRFVSVVDDISDNEEKKLSKLVSMTAAAAFKFVVKYNRNYISINTIPANFLKSLGYLHYSVSQPLGVCNFDMY